MKTYSVQEAQEMLSQLIEQVAENRQHIRVSSSDGTVVMLPEETYDNLLITLELLSTPGLLEKIQTGCLEESVINKEAAQYFLDF